MRNYILSISLGTLLCASSSHAAVSVSAPNTAITVAEGREFSHWEIGDPYDMSNPEDAFLFFTPPDTSSSSISGGILSGTTNGNDPSFYIHFSGVPGAYNQERGTTHPIDTSTYRYLTLRIKLTGTTSPQPLNAFFGNDFALGQGSWGYTDFSFVQPGSWQVVTIDLQNTGGGSPSNWSALGEAKILRIDPCNTPGVTFEIDWARLTSTGSTANQASVTFSESNPALAPFSIEAISAGQSYPLVDGLSTAGTHAVDLSTLPAGSYSIRVTNSANQSATSSGTVTVNAAPQFNFLQPDIRGDDSHDYATTVIGNPWGPFDPADISMTGQIKNISYAGGAFSGTFDNAASPTQHDPSIDLKVPSSFPIDPSIYRMVTYEFEELGNTLTLNTTNVSRIFYGNGSGLGTTEDFLIKNGNNVYELGDITQIPLDAVAVNTFPQWGSNSISRFRFDPGEWFTDTDFRLKQIRLQPFDTAAPSFNFTWQDSDPDSNATISIFLDPDTNHTNGNEIALISGISENGANAASWPGSGVSNGNYNVFARVSDGHNTITRKATGPLRVGALPTPQPTDLVNLSTRGLTQTADNVIIGGVIVQGSGTKRILFRGRGPSLPVPGKVSNPEITIFDVGGNVIAQNNDWGSGPYTGLVNASGNVPTNPLDAAIVLDLAPGAYTAIVRGEAGSQGVCIFEAFDLQPGNGAFFRNMSTRGPVGTGDDRLIGGLIIQGSVSKQVLVRGRGPSISGVPGTLSDTIVTVVDSSGTIVGTFDDWNELPIADRDRLTTTGQAPANAFESAGYLQLAPGAYTAILEGKGGQSGVGIIEFFDFSGS